MGPDWVPDCEGKHTPTSDAEIKNAWNHTATPACIFVAWGLIKHNQKFTLVC